jgi:hypothetical protein
LTAGHYLGILTGGNVFYLQKGTKNELETGRTFATLFSDVCFRSQLLQANSEEEFKKILEEQAKDLAERQRLAVMKIPLTEEKPPITVSINLNILSTMLKHLINCLWSI